MLLSEYTEKEYGVFVKDIKDSTNQLKYRINYLSESNSVGVNYYRGDLSYFVHIMGDWMDIEDIEYAAEEVWQNLDMDYVDERKVLTAA
jgi:hypothetical protein